MASPVRVHIAVEHPVLREAVAAAVREMPGVEVESVSTDGEVGAAIAARLRPDVIVLCERPEEESPRERIARYRTAAPEARLVMLATATSPRDLAGHVPADAIVDSVDELAALLDAVRPAG